MRMTLADHRGGRQVASRGDAGVRGQRAQEHLGRAPLCHRARQGSGEQRGGAAHQAESPGEYPLRKTPIMSTKEIQSNAMFNFCNKMIAFSNIFGSNLQIENNSMRRSRLHHSNVYCINMIHSAQ